MKKLALASVVIVLAACNQTAPKKQEVSSTPVQWQKSTQNIAATFVKSKDSKVNGRMKQAEASIVDLISASACDREAPKGAMKKYWENQNYHNMYVSPMNSMQYHKKGCVNVLRVNNWNMVAKNALKFSVAYESPQSGEVSDRRFTALEQSDGSWLFQPNV